MPSILHFKPRTTAAARSVADVLQTLRAGRLDCLLERDAVGDEPAIIGFGRSADILYLTVDSGIVREIEWSPDYRERNGRGDRIIMDLGRAGFDYQDDENS